MTKSHLMLLFGLSIVGCAPGLFWGALAQDHQGDFELSLVVTTDSVDSMGKHYRVERYQDSQCAQSRKQKRMFRKKFADERESLGPYKASALEPFWFQVEYEEERRGEERSCKYLVGFLPKSSGKYEAQFNVSGQVSLCQFQIFDITSERQAITIEKPERSCKKVKTKGDPNGTPVHKSLRRF